MSEPSTPLGHPLPPPSPLARPVDVHAAGWNDETNARSGHLGQIGQLNSPWHAVTVTTWVGVFVAYLAVWKASEEIGLSTWWLGARSDPQPLVIRLVPFFVAALFGILASYNVRRMPWFGLAGAVVLAAIAVPDLSRSVGLAAVEFTIAGAVLVVSLASFTGTYRAPSERPDR